MGRDATILVSGTIAGTPRQGGATWAVLQYLLGFRQLGHTVSFVEPIAAGSAGVPLAASAQAAYFRSVMAQFGFTDHAALFDPATHESVGLPYTTLQGIARRADVLINLSGRLADMELLEPIPIRAYMDLDPVFTQLWHVREGIDMNFAAHTHFVTVGGLVGTAACPIPTGERTWLHALPPVVLSHWPVTKRPVTDMTTVAHWRSYGAITVDGTLYGQKVHSFRSYFPLPTRTDERFRIALAIHPDETRDLAALATHGWRLVDPALHVADPTSYQRFIQNSRAEFGIAKHGYVVGHSGWFSDRSACYLASGRPVLAQDTGFPQVLPTGPGLLPFATIDEAAAGVAAISAEYARHARGARAIAEEFLDANRVLPQLLDRLGAG
jgi:hypothetical protein